MFGHILEEVEDYFGMPNFSSEENIKEYKESITKSDWERKSAYFLNLLTDKTDFLFSTTENLFPSNFLSRSKIEFLQYQPYHIQICSIRIRPENGYYNTLKKPVPRPENPNGYDATGIELDIALSRGFINNYNSYLPSVHVEFTVWGAHERKGFAQFYRNYRRIIEIYLSKCQFEFQTSCVFERLEKYKGNDTAKKLDLYFMQDDDDENTFTLSSTLQINSTREQAIQAFMSLGALYDSCHYYCIRNKNYDKILDYYFKINTILSC